MTNYKFYKGNDNWMNPVTTPEQSGKLEGSQEYVIKLIYHFEYKIYGSTYATWVLSPSMGV